MTIISIICMDMSLPTYASIIYAIMFVIQVLLLIAVIQVYIIIAYA